jgi:dTDP-4-dehydrorhamnose reductase
MYKVLIFGGNSRLARRVKTTVGPTPFEPIYDRSSNWNLRLVPRDEADVRNLSDVLYAVEHNEPDVVVNCAAYTDVDGCQRSPDYAIAVNGLGAANIAMVCRMRSVPLVHISTDYVFPGTNGPKSVGAPTYPVNTYGLSKLLGESAVLSIMPKGAIVMRVGWLYGVEYQKSQPMVAATQGGLRVDHLPGKAYIFDNIKGTPTFVGDAAVHARRSAFELGVTVWEGQRKSFIVHASPAESPVSWYEFLLQDFNIVPMRDGTYRGASVITGDGRPVQTMGKTARNGRTYRPTEGGLIPSEGWVAGSYRSGLDAFIREFREAREFRETLHTKTGEGT